eukprot:1207919-Rhodomonas_salina.1
MSCFNSPQKVRGTLRCARSNLQAHCPRTICTSNSFGFAAVKLRAHISGEDIIAIAKEVGNFVRVVQALLEEGEAKREEGIMIDRQMQLPSSPSSRFAE